MKVNSLIFSMAGIFLALFMLACDDDDSSKTSVDAMLPAEGTELVVTLDPTTNIGNITFDVSSADTSTAAVDAFGGYLDDGTIQVTVTSIATNTNYNIASGMRVATTPSAAGQYSYAVVGTSLDVRFYNEYNGASLDPSSDYYATITVHENEYFEAGVSEVQVNLM